MNIQSKFSALGGPVVAAIALLASSFVTSASAQIVPGDTRVKWNPGHYVQLGGSAEDTLVQRTFADIKPLPNMRGVQTRLTWRELEPTKGNYDFSRIDRHIEYAKAANGKKLFVMISTKAFSAGTRPLPDYMYTSTYGGGVYRISINGVEATGSEATTGQNIALYNAAVRDRLVALVKAIGNRYNRNNTFQGIVFNETALGQAVTPLTTAQKDAFFANLATVGLEARRAMPNSVVMQFLNFPTSHIPELASKSITNTVAIGGPDTFINDSNIESRVYPLYDDAANKVPLGPSVQGENYVTTYQDGPYAPPAVMDLYNFGKGRLHANFMFWSKTLTPETLNPYGKVLNMFKSSTFPQEAAGGLNKACPSAYASCASAL